MIVYIATNKTNGKKYIGYTTRSLKRRIQDHLCKAKYKGGKHYNYLFQRAIRKYEIEGFTWKILYRCSTKKECCEKEIAFIKKYNTLTPNGYNLTEGGDGGIQSKETKLKISRSLKQFHLANPGITSLRSLKRSPDERSNSSKKAWRTKRVKGYRTTKGFLHSSLSKSKMSKTKNLINKISWINYKTQEKVQLSLTDMAKYTNLSIGVFNHLKRGTQTSTKCGWSMVESKKKNRDTLADIPIINYQVFS